MNNKIKELENNNVQKVVLPSNIETSIPDLHFAEWLISSSQGLSTSGGNVNPSNSAPHNVLNEPDSYNYKKHFFSLGHKGNVVVKFSQPVNGELTVYEATGGDVTTETALVEVSSDGKNWYSLPSIKYAHNIFYNHEFTYSLSDIGCIEYVRITDTSVVPGDGFDVDAIGATQLCSIS